MKLSEIKQNPTNPRIIKDDKFQKLVTSIKEFPEMLEARPIVVNPDMIVLGGNMRLKAAKAAGLTEAPVYVATWEESKAKEFIVKDNVGFGEWDWDILANEWDAAELDEWGLDVWQPEEEEKEGLTDPDEVPEAPEEPKTKLGDLYILGEHRLLCGDSTKAEDVEKLMNGEKADISFTSPPYNAGTTPTELKMNQKSKYENDSDNKSKNDYLDFLHITTRPLLKHVEFVFVNIQSISGNKLALIEFLYKMRDKYADTIIWQKQNAQPAMANNVLNSQFEYIHIFSDKANRSIGTKEFRGTISNVLEMSKQTKNKVKNHNATFPFEFAEYFVLNFCENSVLDVFLGSGTTLIAAEKTNRKCYGMELDPKYCDVIVKRWEDFTGKKAELWKQ